MIDYWGAGRDVDRLALGRGFWENGGSDRAVGRIDVQEEREELIDEGVDILSHRARGNRIHVLTADPVLATDVCERIRADRRLKNCQLVRPVSREFRETVREIERMAPDTVGSRLLIMDVRRDRQRRIEEEQRK